MPAEVQVQLKIRTLGGLGELVAESPVQLASESLQSPIIHQIFEPGVPPIFAIAVIALNEHDLLDHVHDLLGRHETDRIGKPRIRLGFVVRHSESTADEHVEPDEPISVDDSDQSDVLRIDVDAVVAGIRDSHLELAGKVGGPVERLVVGAVRTAVVDLLTIEPDVVISPSFRQQMLAEPVDDVLYLMVVRFAWRQRRAHQISRHVATGGERRQEGFIDGANRRFKIALQDAVKLKPLARRDAERPISVVVGELVVDEILLGRDGAGRNSRPDHEHELLSALSPVSVILLIDAVELEDLPAGLVEMIVAGFKSVRHVAAKAAAFLLDRLDGEFLLFLRARKARW